MTSSMTPFSAKNFCCASSQSRAIAVIGKSVIEGKRRFLIQGTRQNRAILYAKPGRPEDVLLTKRAECCRSFRRSAGSEKLARENTISAALSVWKTDAQKLEWGCLHRGPKPR
jgi:hypothetical protein